MNKATRVLTMTGMALAAGLTMGAGPASAASAATAPGWHHDRVVGYFRSPIACERVGRIGELRDRWDNHDCYRVRFGFHRGQWQLTASWGHGPFGHDHGPIGHGHGPIGHGPFGHDDDHGPRPVDGPGSSHR